MSERNLNSFQSSLAYSPNGEERARDPEVGIALAKLGHIVSDTKLERVCRHVNVN